MKPSTIDLSADAMQNLGFSAIPLTGSCFDGFALAPHLEKVTAPSGAVFTRRSASAEALYRYRYQGEGSLQQEIADRFSNAITAFASASKTVFEGLIMVPPPMARADYAPVVALATAISRQTGIPSLQFAVQDRSGPPDAAAKRTERLFAFSSAATAAVFNTKRVLVIDDIYRSGRSLDRFCRLVKQVGKAAVVKVIVGTVVERNRPGPEKPDAKYLG